MALIATAGALLAVRSMETGTGAWRLYCVLALGVLLRADGFVLYAAFLGFLIVADPSNRKAHIAIGLTGLVATMICADSVARSLLWLATAEHVLPQDDGISDPGSNHLRF